MSNEASEAPPVGDDLDAQLTQAMTEDGQRFAAKFASSIAGMIVLVFFLCSIVGIIWPKLFGPMLKALAEKCGADVDKIEARAGKYKKIALCGLSACTFIGMMIFGLLTLVDAMETMSKVNGETMNEMINEVIKQIMRNLGTMNDSDGPIQWPIWIKNPTSADLVFEGINGIAYLGGSPSVDITSLYPKTIPPEKYRRLDFQLEPRTVGMVLGAMSSLITGLFGYMYVELSFQFKGTWDGETFKMTSSFKVPFDTAELPNVADWPGALNDENIKKAIIGGMKKYKESDETMTQMDSLSIEGEVMTPFLLVQILFPIFLILSCGCCSAALIPRCQCDRERKRFSHLPNYMAPAQKMQAQPQLHAVDGTQQHMQTQTFYGGGGAQAAGVSPQPFGGGIGAYQQQQAMTTTYAYNGDGGAQQTWGNQQYPVAQYATPQYPAPPMQQQWPAAPQFGQKATE